MRFRYVDVGAQSIDLCLAAAPQVTQRQYGTWHGQLMLGFVLFTRSYNRELHAGTLDSAQYHKSHDLRRQVRLLKHSINAQLSKRFET
jgi:hypothetical protein